MSCVILLAEEHVLAHVVLGPPRHVNVLGCLELWWLVLLVLLALFLMFSLRLVVLEGQCVGCLVGPLLESLSESQVSVSVIVETFLGQVVACCIETILEGA